MSWAVLQRLFQKLVEYILYSTLLARLAYVAHTGTDMKHSTRLLLLTSMRASSSGGLLAWRNNRVFRIRSGNS